MMVRIETCRLIIRDHCEGDLSSLGQLLTDRRTMRYLPGIACRTQAEVRENLRVAMAEAKAACRTKYFFAIEEKVSLAYVGEIGLTCETDVGPSGGIANLGYFIKPEWWGRGVTSEAARAIIDFGFATMGLRKIRSGCLTENGASERVMQKCGMLREAAFAAHVWHESEWKDRVEYRILENEWRATGASSCVLG